MTELLTVTIGRNIGETPMSDYDWRLFQSSIENLGDVIGRKFGMSVWHGISEESASFELFADANELKEILPILAIAFDQDAIGLWHGEAIAKAVA